MPPLEIIAYAAAGIALLILAGGLAIFMADKTMDDLLRKMNRGD